MKTNLILVLATLSLIASTNSFAGRHDKGGPGPYTEANRKVELADGEQYVLNGTVMMGQSLTDSNSQVAYFKVDLKKQSWLANSQRVANPYYPIDADPSLLADYVGNSVVLNCVAEVRIITQADGTPGVAIYLRPLGDGVQ